MTIQDTDRILINRSGASFQVQAQNFDSVQDTDLLLVNRAGASFKCTRADLDSKVLDDDTLLINRAGVSYRCTGAEIKEISGGAGELLFDIAEYTGTDALQKIEANVDFTDGGLVWLKSTSNVISHLVYDTVRGSNKVIQPNDTDAQVDEPADKGLVSFDKKGFTLGKNSDLGSNNKGSTTDIDYVSYAFKKEPGFIDIVECDGPGTYAHDLGAEPTFMIAKSIDTGVASNWAVYELTRNVNNYVYLNTNAAGANQSGAWGAKPTVTEFSLGTLFNGSTKVIAYLFNTYNAPGVMVSGAYLGNGSSQTINCGFPPRFVLLKQWNVTGFWYMFDSVRGEDKYLLANEAFAQSTTVDFAFAGSGFTVNGKGLNSSGGTMIYLAIA